MRLMQWKKLKCFFQNSLLIEALELLINITFMYSLLELQTTCWPMGCRRGSCWEKELDLYEVILSIHIIQGWSVCWALSIRKRHLSSSWLSDFLMIDANTLCSHSKNNCLWAQAFTPALHMTESDLIHILSLECTRVLGMARQPWFRLQISVSVHTQQKGQPVFDGLASR